MLAALDAPRALDRPPERLIDRSAVSTSVMSGWSSPSTCSRLGPPDGPHGRGDSPAHGAVDGDPNLLSRWANRTGPGRGSPRRVAHAGIPRPGHALDGPLPDPARPRDRPGTALEPRPGHARQPSSAGSPARPGDARPPRGPATRAPARRLAMLGRLGLHTMLVETMLDFAGSRLRRSRPPLTLDPALPGAWPHTGLRSHTLPCGEVAYRLDRPIGGTVHQLDIEGPARPPGHAPGRRDLPRPGPPRPLARPAEMPPPRHNHVNGRLKWSLALPPGESSWAWTWGSTTTSPELAPAALGRYLSPLYLVILIRLRFPIFSIFR